MKKAGGIIGVIAGTLGVIAAFITLFVGGVGSALETEGASTVVGLGWAGVFCSFLVIGLGAATIAAKGKLSAWLLVVVSLITAVVGGTIVAIFMALALLGGILALLDRTPSASIGVLLPFLAVAFTLPAFSAPVPVKLSEYAFDFPKYGHEITVDGKTRNLQEKLTADDYITIDDDGYKLKTLIDRMGRKDRQQFISFFNEHCITGFMGKPCAITASGEIELNEDMKMIFRMNTAKISKGGKEWSNAK